MKKQILLPILVFLLIGQLGYSQISERNAKMSQGVQNALVLDIPDTDAKLVGRLWQNYMKDFYSNKPKYDRKASEWFSDDAKIVAIGQGNSVDVHANAAKAGNGTALTMWINLGGAYLSSANHPERYAEAEKMLMRFALEVARETTKMEMDGEEKELKKLESELRKLKVANDRYHKEIARAEEAIQKAKENIAQNEIDQENMALKIENQGKVIESVRVRLNDL